ncbi:outer membrane protein assembly factor BamB family protein [Streptomyces silvisoli]|uniref:PQQ-binding-like beta-propeller repeat protein n=1 Tax=Streptomyces silvisoli TaxID=3034235 RepID=A0ABT5ZVF2_9ACTN|nr:PQQ-binding-like beta-propeller repeat protein [Streptomyces silvisoli]MDF3293806.1 PQQ-binding-like beta-propeller repeat protein [Streptomyces silvisoli]
MSQPPDGTGGSGAPERAPHEMPTQLAGAAVPPPPAGQPPQVPPPPPAAPGQPVPPPPPPVQSQVPPPPPAAPGQPPQAPPIAGGQPQYGYPAPGYGYPQQPPSQGGPNPYQQPSPYGYQQSPYAQQPPTQPMPQQGWGGNPYGQPQQPPFPAQPGGGSGGRLSGGRLAALIAGIVAAVLVVGGGAYLLTSGGSKPKSAAKGGGSGNSGDNAPHNSAGKVAWTVPAPNVTKQQNIAPTPGMWFSGGDVVKQTPTGVTAYDLGSGQQQWTVPSPEGDTCDAATDIVNDKIAVQYGTHCENVMVVDASTGKLAWNKPLGFTSSLLMYTDMAMSGDVLAVEAEEQTVSFQVSTGKPLWHSDNGSDAHDKGFAGGSQMVEVYYNGDNQENNNHVSLIDPMSGKPKWTWDAPAGTEVVSVISVNPVVVGIGAGDMTMTDVWDVDGGRLGGKISLGKSGSDQGKYAIRCPADKMTPCNNVAVSGNTLYMATSQHSGSGSVSSTNEIAAFDLSNGSGKWLSKSADAPMQLVSVDGNSVIAYQMSGFENAGKVLKADTSSGALSTYTTFDDSTAQQERDLDSAGLGDSDFGWHNNTLAIGMSQIYSGGLEKYLVGALH